MLSNPSFRKFGVESAKNRRTCRIIDLRNDFVTLATFNAFTVLQFISIKEYTEICAVKFYKLFCLPGITRIFFKLAPRSLHCSVSNKEDDIFLQLIITREWNKGNRN